MGWERKRGKLHELNQFLRGSTTTSFISAGGLPPEPIPGVRYVITLDADTRLPRGAVARLVGTMAHALNRPQFSAKEGRVVDGYGLVQPRITPSLPTKHEGSLFQKIFSGPSGIDPYASAVSDVYQDLFREGSYTGKGIYDIDAFEAAMAGKVPENALLSHDLFEGIFARAALASDIELFDDFPSHYEAGCRASTPLGPRRLAVASVDRRAGPRVRRKPPPHQDACIQPLEDDRQSAPHPSRRLRMFLTLSPAGSRGPPLRGCGRIFILATISIPSLIPFLTGLNTRLGGISKRSHIRNILSDFSLGAAQIGIDGCVSRLSGMADVGRDPAHARPAVHYAQKFIGMGDGGASEARRGLKSLRNFYAHEGRRSLCCRRIRCRRRRPSQRSPSRNPFALVWAASPAIAWWISLPPQQSEVEALSAEDVSALRSISRRTWRFFETFRDPCGSSLPPDNFQEDPKPVIAHRTSPTNIGLYLLSTLAARDFGWLGTCETADTDRSHPRNDGRTWTAIAAIFTTGTTRAISVLSIPSMFPPSTAEIWRATCSRSAMAAATSLKTLRSTGGLLEGVRDSLRLLQEALSKITDVRRTQTVTRKHLSNSVDALLLLLDDVPADARRLGGAFRRAEGTCPDRRRHCPNPRARAGRPGGFRSAGVGGSTQQCVDSHYRDAAILIPWLRLRAARNHVALRRAPFRRTRRNGWRLSLSFAAFHPRRCSGAI